RRARADRRPGAAAEPAVPGAAADAPAGAAAEMRAVERHRHRGPARVTGPGGAPPRPGRPSGEAGGSDARGPAGRGQPPGVAAVRRGATGGPVRGGARRPAGRGGEDAAGRLTGAPEQFDEHEGLAAIAAEVTATVRGS